MSIFPIIRIILFSANCCVSFNLNIELLITFDLQNLLSLLLNSQLKVGDAACLPSVLYPRHPYSGLPVSWVSCFSFFWFLKMWFDFLCIFFKFKIAIIFLCLLRINETLENLFSGQLGKQIFSFPQGQLKVLILIFLWD